MQAHIIILGFVQGVGFRRFVKANAQKLGLRGWVKNMPDGRVEAIVSGDKQKIEYLLDKIKKGSFFSEVKSVHVEWEENQNFEDFVISH